MHTIACHECDLLISVPNKIKTNQSVFCPRCKHKQFTQHKNPTDQALAYGLCALFFLIMANFFPFLSFEAQGQSRTITVLQASNELYTQGFYLLSILVYACVLLLPSLYLLCLLLLVIPVKLGIKPISSILLGRTLSYLLPWVMTEVFLIGVLVALIKVIELAEIIFGTAFWAYIAFVVFFLATANIASKHQLWQWVSYGKR